jgi:cysteine-rich repeat protein
LALATLLVAACSALLDPTRTPPCQATQAARCDGDEQVVCGSAGFEQRTSCPAGCDSASGRCVSQCGNGQLDSAEACDDGNTASGDGCRADCAIERCGDGVVDRGPARTEECDDGNPLDSDGCDSMCRVSLDRLVNSTTALNQSRPALAVAPDGRSLVVWEDASTANVDVRAQLYATDGAPLGSEFTVNQPTTTNNQSAPRVAANKDGVFLVVWQDASGTAPDTSGTAIRARRLAFTPSGALSASSDFLVNSTVANDQTNPDVAAAADGSFLVVWEHDAGALELDDNNGLAVRARRFDASATSVGNDFVVNKEFLGDQKTPAVTAVGGDIQVAWQHQASLTTFDVRTRRLTSTGNFTDAQDVVVKAGVGNSQSAPSLAGRSDGTALVAWTDGGPADTDIHGRTLGSSGQLVGQELALNLTTAGLQSDSSVAADPTGGPFLVTWQDASAAAPDASGLAVRARRFSLAGAPTDPTDFVVNSTVALDQSAPAVAFAPKAVAILLWQDASDAAASGLNVRERRLPNALSLPLARP